MTRKTILLKGCQNHVSERLGRIQKNIDDIQQAMTAESKSSAGDKHETGRAMLQLEREKLGNQLYEAEKMKEVLLKVDLQCDNATIGLGNLVRTSKNHYFLSISAGKFIIDDFTVFCISMGTPIAQLLLGKTIGDEVILNGECVKILEIT